MKKILYIFIAAIALSASFASCNQKEKEVAEQKADTPEETTKQQDDEIAELEALLQQVEEGFSEISQAENRIRVERAHGETNRSQAIQDDIQFIKQTIAEKQQKIADLQQMIATLRSNSNSDKQNYDKILTDYEKRIKDFQDQMTGYEQYISDLEAMTVTMSNTIATQKTEIEEKQTTINEQAAEIESRGNTITTQDQELHTAFYVFGTKKELKQENILKDGEVLKQANFNKDYFTKIDIRTTKTIKLYSKSAKLKTAHPTGSYTLEKDSNKQYILRITDADKFWSTSKYLVILVD